MVEVGLGGRFDATNVIENPAVCGIAALGIDHERFLLAPEDGTPAAPLARIAFEKAGIAKTGAPLVLQSQPDVALTEVTCIANRVCAPLYVQGANWAITPDNEGLTYRDDRGGSLHLPQPTLPGPHQSHNAGLAIAMLRHQQAIDISEEAIAAGLRNAIWPARLQRLSRGPLTKNRDVWLDGGHNPSAGAMLAAHFAGQRFHLIIGMIEGKDPSAIIAPLATNIASLTAVPVPDHDWHPAAMFGPQAVAAEDVPSALAALPDDGLPVLIAGSLYLAGEVLRLNDEIPN